MIDPFLPTYNDVEEAAMQALSLFELNSKVSAILQHTLPQAYWLTAEVSELRVNSNGHCYLEFVEKDSVTNSLKAKAKGVIWQRNYATIARRFERATGRKLEAGIKVMVQVDVTFHPIYGYSLNVIDIEPSYTLGDIERRRREIIRQLTEDGVIDLNKELSLPRVIRRVAVISSPTAAGYGDFCNQLAQSGYDFQVQLFPATMQGDKVESTVIEALDAIDSDKEPWDVVVIIRGGGATTDLSGFDSYLLATNVAQFPLPVLTGIGHERDDTIIDMVAHTRLKTPTAVAAFLIESRSNETAALQQLQQRLLKAVQMRLQVEQARLSTLSQRADYNVRTDLAVRRRTFDELSHRFELSSSRYAGLQRERLLRLASRLDVYARQRLLTARHALEVYPSRIQTATERLLLRERHRQEMVARSLRLAGPDRILALGFSITLKDGKAVRNTAQLSAGDEIETRFEHGSARSVVRETHHEPKNPQ